MFCWRMERDFLSCELLTSSIDEPSELVNLLWHLKSVSFVIQEAYCLNLLVLIEKFNAILYKLKL